MLTYILTLSVLRKIIFYTTETGKRPVEEFLDSLESKEAQKILWVLKLIEELADRVGTRKTAISRIENHAEDIKLSTIQKVAKALGKNLEISLR
ncbi:MAG: helix-turn-helix transcriptional regulator [Pseudomonadota bacterium]